MRTFFPCAGPHAVRHATRREFLCGLGASLLARESRASEKRSSLAPRPGHFPAKAKACIFLMMEGGPSHIDTFDPKTKLESLHLKEFARNDKTQSAMSSG